MGYLTIVDIAKEAGVSKATVSRVMNDSGSVSPETRKKILDVIAAIPLCLVAYYICFLRKKNAG